MFLTVFFHRMYKNEIQLLSRVFCYSWLVGLLVFWLTDASLGNVGNPISDGIIFAWKAWSNTAISGKTTQDATTELILSLLVIPLSSQSVSKLCVWISVTPKEVREQWTGWRPLAKPHLNVHQRGQQCHNSRGDEGGLVILRRSGRCLSCYPAFNRRNRGASKDIWNKQAE